ncbi:non-ribosomal peptide synthetase [Cohnella phaseoli]|uniref:Fengycin family lipopeptide synthetase D n=1 Tax=Cohnella phaseoli TaxID=456490 RepID=A0A3D9KK26_9BACL|nr:non-ribosomal peptide synthetase [Cohnella phaseoli]RED86532.1 fengycin family lipopeptide synthetase D [Cohnella phaseoli]
MHKGDTLVELLSVNRTKHKGITFVHKKQEHHVSYDQLYERSMAYLGDLQKKGLRKGDRVVLLLQENEAFLLAFWSCLLGGIVPVPIQYATTKEQTVKFFEVWRMLDNPSLITDSEQHEHLRQFADRQGKYPLTDRERIVIYDELIQGKPGIIPDISPGDCAFIQFSSGSTGQPKGVVLTHENLLTNIRAIVGGCGATESDSSISWLPLTHDMGLIGFHLAPVYASMNQWIMPSTLFMMQPMQWMELVHRKRISMLSSPNFGYQHFLRHFKEKAAGEWDLSCVRLIYNGAEPISAHICEDFVDRLAPYGLRRNAMFPVYGLAEASLAVTFPPVEEEVVAIHLSRRALRIGEPLAMNPDDEEDRVTFVDVGFPVADCEVRISGDDHAELPEGTVGHIHIRGKNVTSGYYRMPQVNAASFTQEGWFITGDIGFMRGGRLCVTGRHKDIIFVNGQNVYPHDIEGTIEALEGIAPGRTAACGVYNERLGSEEVVYFVSHRGEPEKFADQAARIQRALNARMGIDVRNVLPVRAIPKTTSGKTQRYKLAEQFRAGEFAELAQTMTELLQANLQHKAHKSPQNATEAKLLAIWQEVLERERIGTDDAFFEIGGQSLGASHVLARIEHEFEVEVPIQRLFELATIEAMAEYIDRAEKIRIQRIEPLRERREAYPATFAQQRMVMAEQNEGVHTAYVIAGVMKIAGTLDRDAIARAFGELVARHEALRTSFHTREEGIVQIVRDRVDIAVDWRDVAAEPSEAQLQAAIQAFDLSAPPLMRVQVWSWAEDRRAVAVHIHHSVADGLAMNVLMAEFIKLIQDQPLPDLALRYSDFACWQQGGMKTETLEAGRQYWMNALQGELPVTELLTDRRRPAVKSYAGSSVKIGLDKEDVKAIQELAQRSNATLYMVLLSAYSILLAKYCGQEDVLVGSPIAGRSHNGLEQMVGMFVNMSALRSYPEGDKTYLDYLAETKEAALGAFAQQDYPFEFVVEQLGMQRDPSRNPLFEYVFVLQERLNVSGAAGGLSFEADFVEPAAVPFDLTLEALADGDDLAFTFRYATELFRVSTIERVAEHYIRILQDIVKHPGKQLKDIELLTAEEKQWLTSGWNLAFAPYPKEQTIPQLFERQAEKYPERMAVTFNGSSHSYRDINERANQLAHALLASGAGSGFVAGLMADRSVEMIVAILAILKAGGAYLPIDPTFPAERAEYMMSDSRAICMLTMGKWQERCSRLGRVMLLDDGSYDSFSRENLPSRNEAGDLAYIMYTSGSTGNPKGTCTTHANIVRVVKDTNYIAITEQDTLLQLSNYAFDGSTFDIFGALLNGAKLVLADADTVGDTNRLSELLTAEKVTVFFVTTALFNVIVEEYIDALAHVRKILFGGERASISHVRKAFQALGPGKLIHVYGPTETTVFATYYEIEQWEEQASGVPIGKPINGTGLYVMNRYGRPQPIGVPGELWISGDGLARGYLNLPDVTAEKFIPHPYEANERVYRTGDLVRWLPGGHIEFLDRIDQQVKIRGFRIELGEIEACLLAHPHLQEACVIARAAEGSPSLCAYYVANEAVNGEEIRAYLSEALPLFMVPADLIALEAMPLTSNGKINKKLLPAPDLSRGSHKAYVPPTDELERALAALWENLLQRQPIGRDDHFFDLGGHSLKATILLARIYEQFHVKVPFQQFMRMPTIQNLAALIKQGEVKAFTPLVSRENASGEYPVSPAQQRLMIQEQLEAMGTNYNMPIVLKVDGYLDPRQVEAAWEQLAAIHEPLRTSFVWRQGEMRQIVHPNARIRVHAETAEREQAEERLRSWIRPFDLEAAPLVRIYLLRISAEEQYLLIDMHHIIADGVSVQLLFNEMFRMMGGYPASRPRLQYRDYVQWLEEERHSASFRRQQQYWREQLDGELPVLNMPLDYPRREHKTYRGETLRFTVNAETGERIRAVAQRENVTVHTVLFAAYSALLYKLSGQDDFIVGSLVAGRSHPEVQDMVGMFNNFLPIRCRLPEAQTCGSWMQQLHRTLMEAYEHPDFPYDQMIADAGASVDASRNPLFDTMLVVHSQMESPDAWQFGEWRCSRYELELGQAKLDFKLDIYLVEDGALRCDLEFNTDLYAGKTMERFVRHFQIVAERLANDPDVSLAQLDVLTEREREQILCEFNSTFRPYPSEQTLVEQFERQAQLTPDRIALTHGERKWTFLEVDRLANRLARTLRRLGVRREEIIPIAAERSLEMIVGIWAILKAGGAYLPLDPHYPPERKRYILENSQAQRIVTQNQWIASLASIHAELPIIDLDDAANYDADDRPLTPVNEARDLAYVIYTSGSTGQPKGVLIEHRSVINRLNWMHRSYPIDAEDVILQKTPYTFDVSVWELFWGATKGTTLHLLAADGEKDPKQIAEAIGRHRVTTLHFVPSMLQIFLLHLEQHPEDVAKLAGLRQVFASGEALHPHQVRLFQSLLYDRFGVRLVNLYGPTEATVDVSCFDCFAEPMGQLVPIGKPIDNIQLLVVNDHLQLQPIGAAGELCIAGDGLARGYLNQPELTAQKFVDHPFADKQKLYRTGDLVRWREDGHIEYLGRLDHQVKIRGYRIECEEVAHQMGSAPGVREAIVVAHRDARSEAYLCGYYISDHEIGLAEWRARLSETLPDYMIPGFYVRLDQFPLSANGKLNRKALPLPETGIRDEAAYAEPSNEIESRLAAIWQELLGVPRIGVEDNFFSLGGHSLRAAHLVTKIHEAFHVSIALKEVFQSPTIKQLAQRIVSSERERFESIPPAEPKEAYPLSSAQKRLYVLHQMEEANTAYHLSQAIRMTGALDTAKVEAVFQRLIARHESLRTSFVWTEGEPMQRIHPQVDFSLELADAEDESARIRSFLRPFELTQAPLLRVVLIRKSADDHVLLFDMHHLIADGLSTVHLANEFIALYEGKELPPLRIQVKDYTEWQNRWLSGEQAARQERFWLGQFADGVPTLQLPTDFVRPSRKTTEGDRIVAQLSERDSQAVRDLAARHGATPYMALLAAFNVLLHKYSGQDEIVVGTPVSGRTHSELQPLIGMFVNTLALKTKILADGSYSELLAATKELTLEAFQHQDYPFERLIDQLKLERDLSRNPLFDAMFIVQNMGLPELELDEVAFAPYALDNPTAKFDLTLEVVEHGTALTLNLEYATSLFTPETAERMLRHYIRIVQSACESPDAPIDETAWMSEEEQQMILGDFNATRRAYPEDRTLLDFFETQAANRAEQVAVQWLDLSLGYRELNERANRLARTLREHGVKPDSFVPLLIERSPEMLVAILAIWKAGGAYLPVSPDFPAERIQYLLQDSGAGIVVGRAKYWLPLQESISELQSVTGIDVDSESSYADDRSNLPRAHTSRHLAYVIYTSGSTGRPKGTMIEHRSVVNRLLWMQEQYPLLPDSVILQKTPFTFDVSVWELFWWMIPGSRVALLESGGEKDPALIVKAIEKYEVSHMHFVPPMLKLFLEHFHRMGMTANLNRLAYVFASGEALQAPQVEQFQALNERFGTRLINLYGPTEATVDVSHYECGWTEPPSSVPIGKPIYNTSLLILNDRFQLQPIGVPGELCIAGDGLARGYANRPELTAQAFVDHPFLAGRKLYRTGDLARWLPDGNIQYLGRRDNQVKIRGFRIELGEIEQVLLKHEHIRECVVVVKRNKQHEDYLCGYMVASQPLSGVEVKAWLQRKVPEYMVPGYIVQLDQMPLSFNGKLDRKALPEPQGAGEGRGDASMLPNNEIERRLAAIWQELSGTETFGVHDNFFDIGGNSLLLVRAQAEIDAVYPDLVKVTDLFTYSTVFKLAEHIRSRKKLVAAEKIALISWPLVDFGSSASQQAAREYRYTPDKKAIDQLTSIAARLGVEIRDIWLAIYGYLLHERSKQQEITIQVVRQPGFVGELRQSFAQVNHFGQLIASIHESLRTDSASGIPLSEWRARVVKTREKGTLLPVFSLDGPHSLAGESDYDICIGASLSAQREIQLVLQFNAQRLNSDRMKRLLQSFVQIMHQIIEAFAADANAAVARETSRNSNGGETEQ